MKKNQFLLISAIALTMTACSQQDELLPNATQGTPGKITVSAKVPDGNKDNAAPPSATRIYMENYKNAANYDAFKIYWTDGDIITGVAWQGDDDKWYENAKSITVPPVTLDNLKDKKTLLLSFDIPDGFNSALPLKIALFYVHNTDNDSYSNAYQNTPISFSIADKGLTWYNAQMVKRIDPVQSWQLPDFTYLYNRTPMMGRMELPAGWAKTPQVINTQFLHLTTLFGVKIYNSSDADFNLQSLEMSITNAAGTKFFLTNAGVIDPISGAAVSDANHRSETLTIDGIQNNVVKKSSSFTYFIPCILLGNMTGAEISVKINGQQAASKTAKKYLSGNCYSMDMLWNGTAFSLLDHTTQSSMFSYKLSEDGKTLTEWTGNESVVDMNIDPNLAAVTTIAGGAFSGRHGFKKIIVGNNVTTLEERAFYLGTGFDDIYLPASLVNIGESAFKWCSGNIHVNADNPNYASQDGVLFNKDKTKLLAFPTSKTGSYTVPSTVKEMADDAFSSTLLTSIVMPASLEKIGNYTFYWSRNLESADFDACTAPLTIAYGSFDSCNKLKSVHLPGSLQQIGNRAFVNCEDLASVSFGYPSSLTAIEASAFSGCEKINYMVLPSSLNTLGSAFGNCKALKEISLPEGLTKIEELTFTNCEGLKSVTFPSTLTDINKNAFYNNKLVNVYSMAVAPPRLNGTSVFAVFGINYQILKPKATLYLVSTASETDYLNLAPFGGYLNATLWTDFPARKIMKQCSVSANGANIGAAGGNASVSVTADTPWTAVSDQSWLTVSPASATGSGTLTFTASANTTGRIRVAYVVVEATDAPTRLISVVQAR